MKELNLNVDFSAILMNEEDKKLSSRQIMTMIIRNILNAYITQLKGLLYNERKLVYSIQDKLKEVDDTKKDTIEFEDNEFGFIKRSFRETKLTPNDLLRKMEEIIDSVNYR